jgi:hypothetical protein
MRSCTRNLELGNLLSICLKTEETQGNLCLFCLFDGLTSTRTSKRTPLFTITKINWLMLFKEIIAVYRDNHTKPVNKKNVVLQIVKISGTYNYH